MDTKVCGRCKLELPVDSFRWKNQEKGWRQSYCIECNKQKNREHYLANKTEYSRKAREWEATRGGKSAYRHNLTSEEYQNLFARYSGKCWSCKERPATVVDHDHTCCSGYFTCGKCVRGALCSECNTGIGKLGDSIEGLNTALAYLKNHGRMVE